MLHVFLGTTCSARFSCDLRRLFRRLRRRVAAAVLLCMGTLLLGGDVHASVQNDDTEFPIVVDGRFSLNRAGRQLEWSDVDALAFISSPIEDSTPLYVPTSAPSANCLVAAISRVRDHETEFLWLVFAFEARTVVDNGIAQVASFEFPYSWGPRDFESSKLTLLTIVAAGVPTFFGFEFDLTGNGISNGAPSGFGIEAAASIGPSPLSAAPHLVVEMRIPLLPEGAAAGVETRQGTSRNTYVSSDIIDDERKVPQIGPQIIIGIASDGRMQIVTQARVPAGFPVLRRGDANVDGRVDLSDAVFTLGCLFQGAECPRCPDAADTNDDNRVDLSDAVSILDFAFQGGPPPPTPGPFVCGFDPSDPDVLGACDYDRCD